MLPELRQELRLFEGPRGGSERSWLIHDPIRYRYFQVSRAAFLLLQIWRPVPAEDLAALASLEFDRIVAVDDINELTRFLIANNLTLLPPHDDARALAAQQAGGRHSPLMRVLHGYLFFRLPLLRPERFLNATLPLVAPLYSRTAAFLLLSMALTGLYFTSRQWDLFVTSFLGFFSFEGAFAYAVTLIAVKALHELGHAYTAARAGVRVNTMGIAFMVMTPILYTDVTDAWRLPIRRDKLAIDAAGIVVELALAAVALFLWAFLEDGPLRSAAFVTATTSLVIGLAINLNPLMRFDGYYLLADIWQVPSLQPRSNAMARWWLRELLFGIGKEPPEYFPTSQRIMLVVYAGCVWIYRLLLFLGIAIIVYHMFFKALGILLFAIEILWFILMPIANELREWWRMRGQIATRSRSLITGGIAAGGLAALVIPWSGTVTVQAIAMASLETTIFAPRPGRIDYVNVANNRQTAAGERLLVVVAPELLNELTLTRKRIGLTRLRLDRIAGDAADRSNRVVLESELARDVGSLAGLLAEQQKLTVLASEYGVLRDVDLDMQAGEWINDTTVIGRIVTDGNVEANGYLGDDDVRRVAPGAAVTFVPEDPLMRRLTGRVIEVVETGVRTIEWPYLASVYGGAIAVDRNGDDELRPRSGLHLVRVALDGGRVERVLRGTLHLAAERESLLTAMWRRVLQILVRESSA